MIERTATIIGATGMTGNYLLQLLLADDHFTTVRVIVRRPVAKTNPKMEVKLVDFNDAESIKLALEGTHTLFCCIGTTNKKVKGDKALYRQIDFDIPLKTARFAKEAGCRQLTIMSSVGADAKSSNFYLKLKGEVEDAIKAIGFQSVHIVRPSMLLGQRNEKRFGENVIGAVMKLLSPLLPSKYKAIEGEIVAKAMLSFAKEEKPGCFIHENAELRNYHNQ